MDLFSKCKELYEKIRYSEYGIPVDGVIKPAPSAEYFVKNYHFLKPEEFEKYKGGICWDYVEYERKFLEVNDIDFNQYYIITNTPPNYDTHTFITVKDGDDLIYIESSFKRVEHIIDGVQKFKTLEDIVKLITTNMWYCNDNDKHFDEFKYDVCKFKGHPQYGCTCEEYMKWMDDNSDIVIQDVSINPKKVNEDELTVEEFSVNKIDTKFTKFVCESVNDPEEYDETLHDHIDDEDDVYNESWVDSVDSELIMESQKRRDSYLKKIKYDPKTQTVDTGILDTKTGKNIRIKIKFDSSDPIGAYYQSARSKINEFKTENGYDLNKFLDNVYINMPKDIFNKKKNAGLTVFYHEIGHFLFDLVRYFRDHLNPSDVERLMKWDAEVEKYTASLNEDMVDNLNNHDIDAEEMMADLNATSKVSRHSYDHVHKKSLDQNKNIKGLKKQEKILNSKIEQAKANKDSKQLMKLLNEKDVIDTQNAALREDATSIKARLKANEELTKNLNEPIKEYAIQESWTDFKNGVHPASNLMFHVSLKNDMDGKTITPQLPSYITDGGELDDNYQEDTKTKRLCVSPSIEGCLIAILNYKKIREHVGDKFYVYTPEKPFSQYKHKTNKEIVKDKLVFDANITKEAWILEPCKLKLYGIIKLKKVKDLKKKPTVEKGIKMNTIKLDYEWIMTPKASGKFNKVIGDSPNDESDKKEKPINEYAVPGSFYHDIKPHLGGVYALVEDDSYRSHFCHIDFQGHDNKYLGWNEPTGSELILKTQEVIKSEKWEFHKSETDTVIPEYTHIFTYAQQILPIIRLDKIKDRLNELLAPHCPLTVHDPNSDTDIEYVCIQPQQYEVIDKKQTSYVYDTAYKEMFENHIVYLPIVDNLGMFEVKHTTHVAGTYDDNLFFEELFYGPTISYKLFDAFKDLNSVTLYDISDINAWDFACGYEDHYDEDGERIEPGDPKHPSNKQVNESSNILVSNEEFFEEFVSSKQRNREKKFLKERNFVPDKDNSNKGWIDSDFKDKDGKPKRIRFEINNESAIAATNGEDKIQMTRKALRTHPGISSADFKHEEGHMFAKQKYKEWAKSHPKPDDMSLEDHMNEFYKSGEFKDFFGRIAKDLEKAAEKGMTEHGKNLEEYFADAFALANSLNESMDIKSIRTMGSRVNSNKEYNKLLNRFNENIDNIIDHLAKSMISMTSNDTKWVLDCPENIRNNEHFKKLRKAISDCQLYKKLIQTEEWSKEMDRRIINLINSSLHDQKSIEAKAKLKRNKEEMMAKIKKQDEKIQSMKAELKIKKKFVEDCKKDIHHLYKASAAANSDLTKMQKEIIDDVKKSQTVLNNEIEFRTKMLEKLSKDEKNQLKINESTNVIVPNDEFFMEASKNPDVKARKRTVNNLRRLGVDRAHEVDDKKLEKGVDINITDSYGNKHKTTLTSKDDDINSYLSSKNIINITPKTMSSNKFDATFNHEAGHAEQNKRIGFDKIDENDYTTSNTDEYPIKCAKLFLQKNKDKMNSHDAQWTELHADFLSCKKSGFGKMIKDIYSLKKSKKQVEDSIDECIKNSEQERKHLANEFLKYTNEEGNELVASEKDVEKCIKAYEQVRDRLEHYYDTLAKRNKTVFKKWLDSSLSEDYRNKARKLMRKIDDIQFDISEKLDDLSDFKHNGISIKNVKKFKSEIEMEIDFCNRRLKDLKAAVTTYDYRAKFIEDMYWIHKGHPGRCSIKYPPMSAEDKKYMQEADCILVSNDEFFNLIE